MISCHLIESKVEFRLLSERTRTSLYGTFCRYISKCAIAFIICSFIFILICVQNGNPKPDQTNPNPNPNRNRNKVKIEIKTKTKNEKQTQQKINYVQNRVEHGKLASGCHLKSINHNIILVTILFIHIMMMTIFFFGGKYSISIDDPLLSLFLFSLSPMLSSSSLLSSSRYFCIE